VIVARLRRTDRARVPAWIGLGASAAFISVALAFFKPNDFHLSYGAFALGMVAWLLAPLGTWNARSKTVNVTVEREAIRVAQGRRSRRIARADVTAVSVAKAAKGASVAVQIGRESELFEVTELEDAKAIARALTGEPDGAGVVDLRAPKPWPILARRALAILGPVACALYWLGATSAFPGGKEVWGSASLGMCILQTIAFVLGAALRTRLGVAKDGIVVRGAHVAASEVKVTEGLTGTVLETPAGAVRLPSSWPGTAHVRIHAAQRIEEPRREPTRSRLGMQEGETVRSWLDRLDGWSHGDGVYRGDLPTAEELAATVADETHPLDVRLGARRLLSRSQVRVRIAVDDEDVQRRLDAVALEEAEEAEAKLLRLGPVFHSPH
jgi:hypothetical protein